MSTSWAKGSTRAWRKLRARILDQNQRDNQGKCTLQLEDVCTGQADTVHHTLGRAITGDDPRYLVAACMACNRNIGEPKRTSPAHR
ncbi:MAG: HNH endonuclease, partial [bacterium]